MNIVIYTINNDEYNLNDPFNTGNIRFKLVLVQELSQGWKLN